MRRGLALSGALLSAFALAACERAAERPEGAPSASAIPYEVWVVDQSDSNHEGRFGGTLRVFDGAGLEAGTARAAAALLHTVDLGGRTAELCMLGTGSNPVRPHMLLFNAGGTHAAISFVASGHVVIMDAATREPIQCFRMTPGASEARQAHAAFPSPDGTFVVVANQNGKLLERIDTDYATNTFVHRSAATLDLVNGVTPAGLPLQSPELRPDNAPICPIIDSESRYVWVTLRGGGLFVVDAKATPMRIVAEYDRQTVRGNGCGGVEAGGAMFVNSGGSPINLQGQPHDFLHLYGFDVYRFPLVGYGAANAAPNTPAPTLVFSAEGMRDSHGMASVMGGRYVWVMDRHADVAEVISVESGKRVATVPLTGPLTDNPAPDLVDVSPSGDRLYVALRGPTPLTGDPHNATGSTPGLGVISVRGDGSDGLLVTLVPFSNIFDGRELADPHAVRVRRVP